MTKTTVPIVQKIMNANDQIAQENNAIFTNNKLLCINVMASPGAGKTSLILKTIENLSSKFNIAVIEGDTAPVTIDSDKINQKGIPVTQINTGGECHLDALMVKRGLDQLPLQNIDLLIIENVVASIPEGDDKPYKYPNIYRGIQALVLNKIDLMPYVDFDIDYFSKGIEILNPNASIFPLSCKTDENFEKWTHWLTEQITMIKK